MTNHVPLRSLISSYVGGGWGNEELEDSHTEPAYVIRGTDFADAEFGSVVSVPYRFHETSNLASRRLEPNDIIMEVSGGSVDQPVGRVMLVDEHVLGSFDGAVMCASFCKRVVPDTTAVEPSFLYWYLQAVYATGLIERYQVQSTGIRNLQFEYLLDDLPVRLPRRDEQQRTIAALDLILELLRSNRRRIEVLEETARLLYREWFQHFRFPGHQKVEPLDSAFGPIPEGWEAGSFGDLVGVSRDAANPNEIEPGSLLVGLEHLPRRSTTLHQWDLANDVGSRKSRFFEGDILFGKIRPYFHKVVLAPIGGYCSTDAIVFRPRTDARAHALAVASSDESSHMRCRRRTAPRCRALTPTSCWSTRCSSHRTPCVESSSPRLG